MYINDLTIDQRIKLLSTLDSKSCRENAFREQILNSFKPEPIQETKDPEPETFEIGEEGIIIQNTSAHSFKIDEHVKVLEILPNNKPNTIYYRCIGNDNKKWAVEPKDIKKLPKPTINKEELRKHLEAAYKLWNKPPFGRASLIDKYLETL